jgi:hypothetical protein
VIDTAGNVCIKDSNVAAGLGQYLSTAPTLTNTQKNPLRLDVKGRLITTNEKRATYSVGIGSLALAAAATDFFCIQGSATKTIIVKKIEYYGAATNLENADIFTVKRSSANTGGTSTNLTVVPMDSTNAAPTATVTAYTANPTTGTLVGIADAEKMTFANNGTGANSQIYGRQADYGIEEDQGFVIRGTSEEVCLNLGGATVAGGVITISTEFREIVE